MDNFQAKEYAENQELKIFTRGMILSIKHPLMNEASLSVIQKVESNNIYFRIPDGFLKNNVLKGDRVTIQIIHGDYEYVLEAMISEFEIQYPSIVAVMVDKVHKYKNNRLAKRYLVNFPTNIFLTGQEKTIYAVIKNISESGIGAVFKEQISKEDLVNVRVSALIKKREVLTFKAQVVRVSPKPNFNECGMKIVGIDDYNKDLLDKVIYKLQEDERLFISEYLK